MIRRLGALLADVPVDPDDEQARQWILDELAKPPYQAAKPTWFDLLWAGFWEWLTSLDLSGGGAAQGPLLLLLALVAAGALVAAFLIFGVPRLNRRSAAAGALFSGEERRSAQQLRESAARAAAGGDWATAIEELFRAIARLMAERTVLTTSPGTTAREFAVRAGSLYPEHTDRLGSAATVFDGVRYLGHAGTAADYEQIRDLEKELRASAPRFENASEFGGSVA